MTSIPLDSATGFVLAGARGVARGGSVGTEHLLVGLAGRVGRAAGVALEALDLNRRVLVTVVSRREWESSDEAEPAADDSASGVAAWYEEAGRPTEYTSAARAALQHAAASAYTSGRPHVTPVDVLLALLDDEHNRATEVLSACGVDSSVLRHRLLTGEPLAVADRVDPQLRRTRDVLLGRTRYRGLGVAGHLFGRLPMFVYEAQAPVLWAMQDAQDRARAEGRRRPSTDHVVLAITATHEVAQLYPHLVGAAGDRYDGGRWLADSGLHYHNTVSAVRAQAGALGSDPRPVKAYAQRGEAYPRTTGELLEAITRDGDTRAARLLRTLGLELPVRV